MKKKITAVLLLFVLALTACGGGETMPTAAPVKPAAETAAPAPSETPAAEAPAEDMAAGLTPVYADAIRDGVYKIEVDSSSSMFNIVDCTLTVENGGMTAEMKMGGTGYLKVFMGTEEAAETADDADCIPFTELSDGAHSFTVPVEALDKPIDCAAFSKKKEQWYPRTLVFRADKLPLDAFADGYLVTAQTLGLADGEYTCEVALSGGSGKASVQSPAEILVENGEVFARLVWSSKSYDYMRVGGERFDALSNDEGSVFEIPVAYFDRNLPVTADTVAMSTPHEIDYTLSFDSSTIK